MILKIQRADRSGWHLFEVDHIEYFPIGALDWNDTSIVIFKGDVPTMEERGHGANNPISMYAEIHHRDVMKTIIFNTAAYLCNDAGQTIENLSLKYQK